uniref:Uncharacterized protein n=1 Tax=Acrobeloides nanus TaxID=290746 RepID=A0A914CT79_9BILA
MRPQLFWNVALSMLFCLGIMHIRYHNFVLVSTKIHKFDIGSKKESFFYTYKEYCVFPNIIQASVFYYDRITLVLHISYDRLDPSLIDQVTNWDAPISLAVVFPKNIFIMHSEIACSAQKLLNYTKNNQKVKKHLSVHFLLGNNTGCDNSKVFYDSFDFLNKDYCSSTNRTTPTNEKSRIQRISQYPVNVARNVARKNSRTKYILIADMDHFFSENFELQMRNMASELLESEPKTVLVYRIFEVSSKVR